LELALSQEVYEYLEELDEMNWSARGNVLNQYLRNTSIGTTVMNYDCTAHPILPFITITTKFLSKHCIKRVLDTEMNSYRCFNFTEKLSFAVYPSSYFILMIESLHQISPC
jgi:hypothetical protein